MVPLVDDSRSQRALNNPPGFIDYTGDRFTPKFNRTDHSKYLPFHTTLS